MRVLVTNISWDLHSGNRHMIEKPERTMMVVIPDDTHIDEMEEVVSDAVSDNSSFCHFGFNWEILPEKSGE